MFTLAVISRSILSCGLLSTKKWYIWYIMKFLLLLFLNIFLWKFSYQWRLFTFTFHQKLQIFLKINRRCLKEVIAQLLNDLYFKGALSGLRQFLATESPLKLMKNTFYFISKDLFVLKIFKFLSRIFGHAAKRLA